MLSSLNLESIADEDALFGSGNQAWNNQPSRRSTGSDTATDNLQTSVTSQDNNMTLQGADVYDPSTSPPTTQVGRVTNATDAAANSARITLASVTPSTATGHSSQDAPVVRPKDIKNKENRRKNHITLSSSKSSRNGANDRTSGATRTVMNGLNSPSASVASSNPGDRAISNNPNSQILGANNPTRHSVGADASSGPIFGANSAARHVVGAPGHIVTANGLNGAGASNADAVVSNWKPTLQVKKYDNDQAFKSSKKVSNSAKQKKDTTNMKLNQAVAAGNTNGGQFSANNPAEVCFTLQASIDPMSNPQNVGRMYYKPENTNQNGNMIRGAANMMGAGGQCPSNGSEVSNTGSPSSVKVCETSNFTQYKNIWAGGRIDESLAAGNSNASNRVPSASTVNMIHNDLEAESNPQACHSNTTVLKLPNPLVLTKAASSSNLESSPIVVPYDQQKHLSDSSLNLQGTSLDYHSLNGSTGGSPSPCNAVTTVTFNTVPTATLPSARSGSLSLRDSLPSAILFGTGNGQETTMNQDFLLAQQLQRKFDMEEEARLRRNNYDIPPNFCPRGTSGGQSDGGVGLTDSHSDFNTLEYLANDEIMGLGDNFQSLQTDDDPGYNAVFRISPSQFHGRVYNPGSEESAGDVGDVDDDPRCLNSSQTHVVRIPYQREVVRNDELYPARTPDTSPEPIHVVMDELPESAPLEPLVLPEPASTSNRHSTAAIGNQARSRLNRSKDEYPRTNLGREDNQRSRLNLAAAENLRSRLNLAADENPRSRLNLAADENPRSRSNLGRHENPRSRLNIGRDDNPRSMTNSSNLERTTSQEDASLARMIQEEQDAEYARMLQEQENEPETSTYPVSPTHVTSRYLSRNMQPLHSLIDRGADVRNRPLRVGPTVNTTISAIHNNVSDSRGSRGRSRDRPLQINRRNIWPPPRRGNDLEVTVDVNPVEGYDIPPNPDYYYRYHEFDPDYMQDEHGEDRLISMNRDPQLLASLLVNRAPNMMIPTDVDLNDYEALWELAENLEEVRRVGMEESDIARLPVHTYTPSQSANSEDAKTDCLVCLCEFTAGEQLRTLPCCHIYHLTCIDQWLQRNAICPVCRQPAK